MMAKHGFLDKVNPLRELYDHFINDDKFAAYMVREYFYNRTYLSFFTGD
jgi:hypothetical protein